MPYRREARRLKALAVFVLKAPSFRWVTFLLFAGFLGSIMGRAGYEIGAAYLVAAVLGVLAREWLPKA
jgi:hypothetical protein